MGWSIDDFFQWMSGDHIGIMNLPPGYLSAWVSGRKQRPTYKYSPEIDENEKSEEEETMKREYKDE